jgi:NhaP-type Na+/H+ or K+/H+ antiporter
MLAVLSAAVLVTVAALRFVKERLFLTEPIIALGIGLLLGPALGWIHPRTWGHWDVWFEEILRIAVAIQIVGITIALPKLYAVKRLRSLALVFGVVMPLMWATSTLLAWLFLPVSFWLAAVVGATVTPTDPLLANTITSGPLAERNLTPRLRHLLSAESAANDGLAYLFIFLAIAMLKHAPGEAFMTWLSKTVLWHVFVAGILFAALGVGVAKLRAFAEKHHYTFKEHHHLLAYNIALALLVLGAARWLKADALFAAFTAGTAFSMSIHDDERADFRELQSTLDRMMIVIVFTLLLSSARCFLGATGLRSAGARPCSSSASCSCVVCRRCTRCIASSTRSSRAKKRCCSAGSARSAPPRSFTVCSCCGRSARPWRGR